MNFTNPQTALVFDWLEANVYLHDVYQESQINEDFEGQLAIVANDVWKNIHPELDDLNDAFYPIFWDEVAQALTEKIRKTIRV